MRTEEEKLRNCPTCGQAAPHLGLRDYSKWLYDLLPARIGASDIDAVIEQHDTGRVLVHEYKPNKYIPRGQELLLDRLCMAGMDVWVVVDTEIDNDQLTMCIWQPESRSQVWREVTVDEFRLAVKAWWDAG